LGEPVAWWSRSVLGKAMVISLRDETLELGGSDEIESIEGFESGKIV
jgi:hypothetical protein